jgi:hypothetical protein
MLAFVTLALCLGFILGLGPAYSQTANPEKLLYEMQALGNERLDLSIDLRDKKNNGRPQIPLSNFPQSNNPLPKELFDHPQGLSSPQGQGNSFSGKFPKNAFEKNDQKTSLTVPKPGAPQSWRASFRSASPPGTLLGGFGQSNGTPGPHNFAPLSTFLQNNNIETSSQRSLQSGLGVSRQRKTSFQRSLQSGLGVSGHREATSQRSPQSGLGESGQSTEALGPPTFSPLNNFLKTNNIENSLQRSLQSGSGVSTQRETSTQRSLHFGYASKRKTIKAEKDEKTIKAEKDDRLTSKKTKNKPLNFGSVLPDKRHKNY